MDIEQKLIDKVQQLGGQMIDGILRLVRIDSVETEAREGAPFGEGVKRALEEALSLSQSLGFAVQNLDNYIGYAQYGEGDGYVCAIGHVDVVPAGEGWRQPPFSGHVEDNVIYSRGVLDNKGPILSCLYGLYAIKELGLEPKRPVRVIFGCDEESGFEDLSVYLEREKPPVYGFTPDCKYPVVYGERGRAVVKISAGLDKLEEFFRFVTEYFIGAKNTGDRLGIDVCHPEYGTMEMRGYRLRTEGDRAAFEATLSYPAGATKDELLSGIREKAGGNLAVELTQNYDPVVFEKDSPMVKALQHCYERVTGLDGTPVTTTGGTYAKAMPGIVPFGPSFPGQKGIAHNPNEWMRVEDLIANAKIYALALYYLSRL